MVERVRVPERDTVEPVTHCRLLIHATDRDSTMKSRTRKSARKTVRRARQALQTDEEERIRGEATRKAVHRAEQLEKRSGVSRFMFENGLTLVMLTLFVVSFAGQIVAGRAAHNAEQAQHGQPALSVGEYLKSPDFFEASAENWESEFLQMGLFVLLSAFLFQRGSSESKRLKEPEPVDQDPKSARGDPESPWPVRQGKMVLALYQHSLSIALLTLFAITLTLHAVHGARAYNEEQLAHGGETVSTAGYLATGQFWFESFQNWQSEFLAIAVLSVLSIWLRERGSPQSKPVAAPHHDTGE